jgi:hypothetical protein
MDEVLDWHAEPSDDDPGSDDERATLFQPGPATPASIDPVHYLIQHGYAQLTTYQPDSRFWPFQWIEGGWLLALSLLLIAATIWLVRRRAA